MISELATSTKKPCKHATLQDLKYQREYIIPQVENEVCELEVKLLATNRLDFPGRWMNIEAQLGDAYKRLMNFYR